VATITDWIEAARNGARRGSPDPAACRNTPQSTLATLAVIDAIYQASREGRRIECRIG
jgi:predicted dehydrogenase